MDPQNSPENIPLSEEDPWDPKFWELDPNSWESEPESEPETEALHELHQRIIRLAEENAARGTYWSATMPKRVFKIQGATTMASRHRDQPEDNRLVYWPAYMVTGLVDEILDRFRGVDHVTIDGEVMPLTRETIINTSIDPLTIEGKDMIENIIRNTPRPGRPHMINIGGLVIGSSPTVRNPGKIVIPSNHVTLDLNVFSQSNPEWRQRHNLLLTSKSPNGFTHQDLTSQMTNVSQRPGLEYLNGSHFVAGHIVDGRTIFAYVRVR